MAITTSKPEIFSPGVTDISWRSLPTNIGGQGVQNIRFGVYKRVVSPNDENPLVPDAEENSQIGTDESGNLSIGAFRGAIKRHDITIGAGEYQNLNFTNYFGNNIIKNIVKKISIGGTIYSDDVDLPAAEIIISQPNEEIINLEVEVTSSGAIYGSGAPGIIDATPSVYNEIDSDNVTNYSMTTQRENDFRSQTIVQSISGFDKIEIVVNYSWSGGNDGGVLSQNTYLRNSSNETISQSFGTGLSGSYTFEAQDLNPSETYNIFHTSTSSLSVGFAEIEASGTITWSGFELITPAREGITGGTALYVQAPSSRNFTIDIDSGGKIYGGGGGGIQGNPGTSNTINTCSQTNSVTVPGNTQTNRHTIPGNPGPTNSHTQNIGGGFSQARGWDEYAESFCRRVYPSGDAFGGYATGLRDTPDRSTCNAGCGPGWPNQVSGTFGWSCNTLNPSTQQTRTNTNPPVTTETTINDSVTSDGGPGGTGGIGQGYRRSFSIGVVGTEGPTVACSSLGSGWSGPSTEGNSGNPGTSGGNWGESGTPNAAGIEGGDAGFAVKTDGSISYEIIGGDDNRLKGQTSPTI